MPLVNFFLKRLIYYFYRLLVSLWRMQVHEHPEMTKLRQQKAPMIFAHWHGDELALIQLVPIYKIATMTSTSKDGQLVDYVIQRLGGATAKGSSTRGAVQGLKGLIRLCRSGRILSIAVDGPKGPIYQPKPGVFELSKLCRAVIVPVAVCAPNSHVFSKAWNKTFLPLPFSRVAIYFSEPIPALSQNDDPKSPVSAKVLRTAIDAAKQQAAKIIATM